MSFVSSNYKTSANAPLGQWVCSPGVSFGPYSTVPPANMQSHPNYCGQCVSYVRQVCQTLPPTGQWKQGSVVKGNTAVTAGTAIATFNKDGAYYGHAAIFVSQDDTGIHVYDQFVAGHSPQAISPRLLRWGGHGDVNNGDKFYVVEKK
jgi:hypothetical protein